MSTITAKEEREAFELALELLLPEEAFISAYNSPFTIEEIAEKFKVEKGMVMVRASLLSHKLII